MGFNGLDLNSSDKLDAGPRHEFCECRPRIFQDVWDANFAWVLRGSGLFQADAEGALLGGQHNFALAREPPNGPFENGALRLH